MRMCVVENSPAPVVCCRERPREPQQASQGGQQSPADSKGTLTRCSERSRCVRQQLKISTITHDKKVVYPSHGPPARCSRSRPDTVLLQGAVEADQTRSSCKVQSKQTRHGPPARCSGSRPDGWQQQAACSSTQLWNLVTAHEGAATQPRELHGIQVNKYHTQLG